MADRDTSRNPSTDPGDVVVIGAGIIGLSIAWQIARRSAFKVTVLEKGAGVGEGSTGASSAICRCRYSLNEMIHLARDGIAAYQRWSEFTGLEQPRARFHDDGVLWFTGEETSWAEREAPRLEAAGVRAEILDDQALAERFPLLDPCILAPDFETGEDHDCRGGGRHLFETNGGYVDPVAAAQDLVDAARDAGVDVRFRAPVASISTRSGRVTGVELACGTVVEAPIVINAAGPWCASLTATTGLNLPWNLVPTRIQVLHWDLPEGPVGDLPVTADLASGIYFRRQNNGHQLIVSSVLEQDEREAVADPDRFERVHDDDFELIKMHALRHRLPGLPFRGRVNGYSGLYTVNRDDAHPILGETELPGYWVANGFSGHGFKIAPAVGSLFAQAITGERASFDSDVPMAFFAPDREPIELASVSVLA